MSLLAKGRVKLRTEDFVSGEAATKKLNTQVLTPIYSRLESLERKLFVPFLLTTATPVASTFPISCPAPPWQVHGIFVSNIWNVTDNTVETTAGGTVQWDYTPDGTRLLIKWIRLTAAKQYRFTLKLEGNDAQL